MPKNKIHLCGKPKLKSKEVFWLLVNHPHLFTRELSLLRGRSITIDVRGPYPLVIQGMKVYEAPTLWDALRRAWTLYRQSAPPTVN